MNAPAVAIAIFGSTTTVTTIGVPLANANGRPRLATIELAAIAIGVKRMSAVIIVGLVVCDTLSSIIWVPARLKPLITIVPLAALAITEVMIGPVGAAGAGQAKMNG